MFYISIVILLLILCIDLFFYLPIKVYFYADSRHFYLYCFSLPIIAIDQNKEINILKNKMDLNQLGKPKKEDLKIIKTIHLKKINIAFPILYANTNMQYIYPLLSLNVFNKFDITIKNKGYLYFNIDIKIVNIIYEIIMIRRNKK